MCAVVEAGYPGVGVLWRLGIVRVGYCGIWGIIGWGYNRNIIVKNIHIFQNALFDQYFEFIELLFMEEDLQECTFH